MTTPDTSSTRSTSPDDHLDGIQGFLLLFASLLVLSLPWSLKLTVQSHTPSIIFLNLLFFVTGITLLFLLLRKSSLFLSGVVVLLVERGAVVLYHLFLLQRVITPTETTPKQQQLEGSILGGVLMIAIWFFYFRYSRRVKATFGRNL